MIVRTLLVVGAMVLIYSCARDTARQDFRREAALERRVLILEQHVRALEKERRPAAAEPVANAEAPTKNPGQ